MSEDITRKETLKRMGLLGMTPILPQFMQSWPQDKKAGGKYSVSTDNLSFEIDENARHAAFVISGKADAASKGADFWRLILDDGQRTEISVCSPVQTGKVTWKGKTLVIEYDHLISEYGDTYPVKFSVTVENENGLLKFTSSIRNGTDSTRVNGCFCPLADFKELCSDKGKDMLYLPDGLGERLSNPWKVLEAKTPYYYAHNGKQLNIVETTKLIDPTG